MLIAKSQDFGAFSLKEDIVGLIEAVWAYPLVFLMNPWIAMN
jgi:hypothetical protein